MSIPFILIWVSQMLYSRAHALVVMEGGGIAMSGDVARLSCRYTGNQSSVKQVVWSRSAQRGGKPTTLASYSTRSKPVVDEALLGRANLTGSLWESLLTLQPLEARDDGYYTCELHTYPGGIQRGSTRLVVYVLPDPELSSVSRSSGVTEVNCTTRSHPASNITWSVEEDQTMGPPTVSYEQQEGGTMRVTSTLLVQPKLFKQLSIWCLVHHPGLDKALSLALSVGQSVLVAVTVSAVSLILLIGLCICLCWYFFCKQD